MTDVTMGEASAVETPAAPTAPMPVSYRRYALALLVAIYTVNFLDRQVVTQLIEPIKNELKLDDFQVGAMGGLWFAILYTVLGIPIARLADRGDRPAIMTASLAIWSGFTLLAGNAWNFTVLAISRMGVGVGEAGCTPTAHSLISEYFPKASRARAMAIYSMGISIGSLLGMALGGIIAGSWGWRVAFLVAGAPGLVLAVLAAFTLAEPRRKLNYVQSAASPHLPIGEALRLLSRKPTFWLLALGGAFASSVSYAHSFFIASFFMRNYFPEVTIASSGFGMTQLGYLGLFMGLAAGIGGVIGSWLGGWWCDKFGAKDARQFLTLPLLFPFISLPVFWYLASLHDINLAMLLLIIPNIGVAIWYGPVYGGVPGLVPPAMRATAAAILLFVINMIGLGGGPTLFGMASDMFANNNLAGSGLDVQSCKAIAKEAPQFATCAAAAASGLKSTIYWSTSITGISFIFFALARLTIRKDMES
ncbi:MAG: MFS transporter [Hyphomonadaceae bacterium]